MKSRQHRKTVQRHMQHWIACARWRHIVGKFYMGIHFTDSFATLRRKYHQPQHAPVRKRFTLEQILAIRKEMPNSGESIMLVTYGDLSSLKSTPYERWPYQDIVFDESAEFISLSQPRKTQFLKSLITKDHP